MKRLWTLLLALSIVLSLSFAMTSCGGGSDESDKPTTASEYYEYAMDYMTNHPYKAYAKTTKTYDGSEYSVEEELYYCDGLNFITEFEEEDIGKFVMTFHDGSLYYSTPYGNKKLTSKVTASDLEALEMGMQEFSASLTKDVEMKLTKNEDGTAKLEFTVEIMGTNDEYVMNFDKDCRLVSYTNTGTSFGLTEVLEQTFEFDEKYKVSAPENADEYEEVDNIMDLVEFDIAP